MLEALFPPLQSQNPFIHPFQNNIMCREIKKRGKGKFKQPELSPLPPGYSSES